LNISNVGLYPTGREPGGSEGLNWGKSGARPAQSTLLYVAIGDEPECPSLLVCCHARAGKGVRQYLLFASSVHPSTAGGGIFVVCSVFADGNERSVSCVEQLSLSLR